MTSTNDLMSQLEADAEYFQPRTYAIYGVARGKPFIGWGLDCEGDRGAVYWDPRTNTTHISTSAEHVLHTQQRIGDAHLKWLD